MSSASGLPRWIGSLAVVAALFSGCAGNILLDAVEGRTHLPSSTIPVFAREIPGSVAAGIGVALLKPEEVHLQASQGHPDVAGRQDWSFPRWSARGSLDWTPWEGITLRPEAVVGSDRVGVTAGASLGLLLHTGVDGFRWGLETRLGGSWSRTRIRSRVLVSDPIRSPAPFADSLQRGGLATLAPWMSMGLHLETGVRRSPWQLWGLARYALQNPSYLTDRAGTEVGLVGLQVVQVGGGLHRTLGRRHVVSAGWIHSMVAPTWRARTDDVAQLTAQWRCDLGE
jgi:hypothetical protein